MYWHTKMYEQWIKKEKYEIHRFWVPHSMEKKVKWLRKYFHVMDRDSIPPCFRRRKSSNEYCETAVMILGRLDQLFEMDVPVVAGSRFLGKGPWAVFGEADVRARLKFRDMEDIDNLYHKGIVSGEASAEYFHFRVAPNLVESIADKYRQTSHYVVCVAMSLLYDILLNCGPDCQEFYDLFTNDLRVTPDTVDFEEWQDLRCKVMGRHGRVREKPGRYKIGQVYEPFIPLVSSTKIELINESDDILKGERFQLMRRPKSWLPVVYGADDAKDIKTESLETDSAYQNRINEISKKYPHLNVGAWCQ